MYRCRILLLMVWMTVAAVAGANEVPVHYVNSHTFLVTVAPQDPESQDAERAELFITRFPESGWVREGECAIRQTAQGKRFLRRVTVPGDGEYYFTSRGSDAIGENAEPGAGTPPQVKIVADTTKPELELTAPVPGAVLRVGEDVRIQWTAYDENFDETPVALMYSLDNGATWRSIAAKLANSGRYEWVVPDTAGRDMTIRATATDRNGNVAVDTLPGAFEVRVAADGGMVPAVVTRDVAPALVVAADGAVIPEVPVDTSADDARHMERKTPVASTVDAMTDDLADAHPKTRFPELDANTADLKAKDEGKHSLARSAYIAYVMAGNLARQGRFKDALRYYRTAVDADENFDQAWNDMAMVYKQLGAFTKADACIVRALKVEPRNAMYLHNRGEIYQAAGLELLQDPASSEVVLANASEMIHFAIRMYGMALDAAVREGRLAERGATYFRLGEICYFANQDPVGARQYWLKVLDLHSPTPDLDNVMLDAGTGAEARTRQLYEHYTEMRIDLETWQRLAREYLCQLNQLERGVAPQPALTPGELAADETVTLTPEPVPNDTCTPAAPWLRPGWSPPDYASVDYGRRPCLSPAMP